MCRTDKQQQQPLASGLDDTSSIDAAAACTAAAAAAAAAAPGEASNDTSCDGHDPNTTTGSTAREMDSLRQSLAASRAEVSALRSQLQTAQVEVDALRMENEKMRRSAGVRVTKGSSESIAAAASNASSSDHQEFEGSPDVNAVITDAADNDSHSTKDNADPVEDGKQALGMQTEANPKDIPEEENNTCSEESDTDSEGHDNDNDNEKKHKEADDVEDIRLRAARTLIWADSAIRRAEVLKEQQRQQQGASVSESVASPISPRGSVRSGLESPYAHRSSYSNRCSGRKNDSFPDMVQIAASSTNEGDYSTEGSPSNFADVGGDQNDDESALSEDDYSTPSTLLGGVSRGSSVAGRRGPLANIRQYLEDKMDDVADRLLAGDPSGDEMSDYDGEGSSYLGSASRRSFRSAATAGSAGGSVSGARGVARLPPRSPASYKYCNDAMKKKLTASTSKPGSSPSKVSADDKDCDVTDGTLDMPSMSARDSEVREDLSDPGLEGSEGAAANPPRMNEAMMRLSAGRGSRRSGGLGSRLFR